MATQRVSGMRSDDVIRRAARAANAICVAQTPDAAACATLSVAAELGFHSLSAVEKPRNEDMASAAVLFTNVPEPEVAKYRSRGYAAVDPIVQRTLRGDGPRLLSGLGEERLTALERKVLSSYHCASGVSDGLVIPVRRSVHPDGVIAFGGVRPQMSPSAQTALTVLGHCFYGRLEELLMATTRAPKPALSKRELEILAWVAKGKSDAETAIILGISERTARFHMANAKTRLNATTRVQAVTRAIELKLIEG